MHSSVSSHLPHLNRLSSLELHQMDDSGVEHEFATGLPALAPTLRTLTLRTLLLVSRKLHMTHGQPQRRFIMAPETSPLLAALAPLSGLQELDLSCSHISLGFWAVMAPSLAAAPLRELAVANCGLGIVNSLRAMAAGQ